MKRILLVLATGTLLSSCGSGDLAEEFCKCAEETDKNKMAKCVTEWEKKYAEFDGSKSERLKIEKKIEDCQQTIVDKMNEE